MNYEEDTIDVNQIKLDLENPRFPPVDNEREAIEAMLKGKDGDKIAKLAQDIYQNGLNPSTRLILFKRNKQALRFVDGDGNRRLTALKILETPSLADSNPKIRKKIDSMLKKSGTVPSKVSCVVFESREAAKHWILVNHDGQQEGRGQIGWDSEQKNRFEGNSSIGLQALDLLAHRGLITPEDKAGVNKTTIDRVLSYAGVKSKLAIKKNGEHFSFGNIEILKNTALALRGQTVDEVYTAKKGVEFVNNVIASESNNSAEQGNASKQGGSDSNDGKTQASNRSRRKSRNKVPVFGGSLSLKRGHINNLYRDVELLYGAYQSKQMKFSDDFIVIFRMSLRMIAETAAKEGGTSLKRFLEDNFDSAKQSLDQDTKTTLANQSVEKGTILQLFHTGAHDYTNSRNEEQALALSIILGRILSITHGREE